MNNNFNKALYLLDMGKYEEGKAVLCKAINECNNLYEKMQMETCYTELLYYLEREIKNDTY